MHVSAISLGSYEDVAPFISLGKELINRGINIRLRHLKILKGKL